MVAAPLLRAHQAARLQSVSTSRLGLNPHVIKSAGRLHLLRGSSFSTATSKWQAGVLDRTRNIGIIAHIDAGKTTTTERMLYYSGFTRRIGDVDEGSTVTDFLPAERARGITIQSAAITFHWPPQTAGDGNTTPQEPQTPRSASSHTVNLIDTPGHADFTFEVMRSLRILDGAVCILDGVAGVEAQTEQVWHQASTYLIPRIVYVNKLDRDGAAFGRTVREVASRLGGWPAVCQIPWFEGGNGRFTGIADAINLQGLRWEEGDGKSVKMFNLEQLASEEPQLAQELKRARVALVELLSEHDEAMVEKFFDCEEDHLAVPPNDILESLRRCLLEEQGRKIIPIFAGASFRNIGVQPLLDAVTNLLPSPPETPEPEVSIGGVKGGLRRLLSGDLLVEQGEKAASAKGKHKKKSAIQAESRNAIEKLQGCALAFKVVNDPKRGVLVYVRVYSGSLDRNSILYNTNLNVSERAPRLLKMYANDAVEVDSIPEGHIGVVAGLKHTRTGDTLVTYSGNKATPPEPLNTLQLRPITVPPPVFFASVEPHSLSEEKRLQESLAMLLREDPSLHVTVDEDSGQTLLSGMGELHLEIARDRLLNDLKAKASMGRIEIGYRECPLGASGPITKIFDKEIAGRKGKAGCTATVEPFDPEETTTEPDPSTLSIQTTDGNQIIIQAPGLEVEVNKKGIEESPLLPPGLDVHALRTALQNGCLAALARGPQFTFPMHGTRVTLTFNPAEHLFGNESTPSALSAAARLATSSALRDLPSGAGTSLMEPVMNVIISVDEASLGAVVHDISSSRGGHIISLDEETPLQTTDITSNPTDDLLPPIDPNKVYAPPDPFQSSTVGIDLPSSANRPRTITAKVPLKEMVGYLKHLRSLSAGRGTFVMSVDRFEKMSAPRQKAVLAELRGDFF
ncbi:Ribosome-releasing factor 2, mitochondrial [Aspergillus flavus]|uniref:Ribosome-releasing factor 2, mitochondrial n=1 Tax=Aspergillus flavus TaxID=5059 RepID=A0AB74C4M5_ASPFL|nr:translation elongation factor G2 [Aspergillus flavus]RAQ61611.1 translation elongation factor G2 [Aspergillus flavus]RMZ40722.1 translation elongation factor G2 [Aspergillus flavus]UDD57585.1 Ribosome-releasing factor 2, mitochondrial [Aspergillus flavus]